MLEHLQQPVEVDDIPSFQKAEEVGFCLFQETGVLVTLISHMYVADYEEDYPFSRNQAISIGLLIRISKFMVAMLQLASDRPRAESIAALHRCVAESAINLEYLSSQNSDEVFNAFVLTSLCPERDLLLTIRENIRLRDGNVLPIEERMQRSINKVCALSGISVDDLMVANLPRFINFKERLKALGKEEQYLSIQAIGSHAVHGTWTDLALHHIEGSVQTRRFRPREMIDCDSRLLTPLAYIVLAATDRYLGTLNADVEELTGLKEKVTDLMRRLEKFEKRIEELFPDSE
jgi:hypothetical protein